MKRNYATRILFSITLFTCFIGFSQESEPDNNLKIEIPLPICEMPVTDIVNKFYVPRSKEVQSRMDNSRSNPCSSFIVSYSGFTPEAQAAYQFAVDIWANLLVSPVPIRINAVWQQADSPNNLGSASPAYFREVTGLPANPDAKVLYPAALFEKLSGFSPIFAATTDINTNFNSGFSSWYFGTDGNTPANQIDLVTVILHELGHGLGMLGFSFENSGLGYIRREANGQSILLDGSSEYASVYDTYVQANRQQDNAITPILDEADGSEFLGFPDPSSRMLTAFQRPSLSINGPLAVQENGGIEAPVLYAPAPYAGGSSYSHWDESKFNNTPNALMTPFAARGEAIHDPGTLTLGFMEDMGWSLCQGSLSVVSFDIESVEVSPNPFNSAITIKVSNGQASDYTINLFDVNGREVLSKTNTVSDSAITISNLDALEDALYFVKITNRLSGASMTKKVIKN
jgi:hypothetical protein